LAPAQFPHLAVPAQECSLNTQNTLLDLADRHHFEFPKKRAFMNEGLPVVIQEDAVPAGRAGSERRNILKALTPISNP
jgi:hypothetical protein